MDYVISCCSPADLPYERFIERGVRLKFYKFMLADKAMVDDCGKSISLKDFYQAMRDGAATKTSAVNTEEFAEYFREILDEGKDILHVELSSGISISYNCARLAAEALKEEYPDRKIYVVDSLGASSGYGFLVEWLCDLRDEGYDIDKLYNFANDNKLRVHHWFYSTDLTFYIRGGRITKVAGFVGTILKICPLMNVSVDGKLIPRFKCFGKNKAIQKTIEQMVNLADDGVNYSGRCIINHSDCLNDAIALKKAVEDTFPALKGKVYLSDIGTTIGCHSGPGTVAIYFLGVPRAD